MILLKCWRTFSGCVFIALSLSMGRLFFVTEMTSLWQVRKARYQSFPPRQFHWNAAFFIHTSSSILSSSVRWWRANPFTSSSITWCIYVIIKHWMNKDKRRMMICEFICDFLTSLVSTKYSRIWKWAEGVEEREEREQKTKEKKKNLCIITCLCVITLHFFFDDDEIYIYI